MYHANNRIILARLLLFRIYLDKVSFFYLYNTKEISKQLKCKGFHTFKFGKGKIFWLLYINVREHRRGNQKLAT